MIVLVITILVIIILAVAVILTFANSNPIENAKKAVSANDESVLKEEATLLYADWYMKKNIDGEDVGDAESYVKENLQGNYSEDLKLRLTVTDDGKVTLGSTSPLIPNDFEYLEGTVEDGFVIKNRTDGNEFVWVPVKTGTFVREAGYQEGALESWNTTEYVEPYEADGYTTEREEYDAMVASVEKYGGFYIARYEASNNGSGLAQSIANQTPWDWIPWGKSMTDVTGGAVEEARAVYPAKDAVDEGDAVSTLPYGVQWDATVRFLETNYPEIAQDSKGYGNCSMSKISTGDPTHPEYMLNNIYDLVGNVSEFTMEAYSTDWRIIRGSDYYLDSYNYPVSSRTEWYANTPDNYGFRLALYIK